MMMNNENSEQRPKKRLGCFGKTVIFFLLSTVLLYYLLSKIGQSLTSYQVTTTLSDNSVYRLDLKGNLVEQGPEDDPFFTTLNKIYGIDNVDVVGLDDLLRNIQTAKTDTLIKGILLSGGELSMGPAKAKELRDALLDFKTSGKWIFAYSEQYGLLNYYVASVADSIFINPTTSITWDGLCGSKMYYTNLLKKLGVDVQIFKVGTFKAAIEPFTRTSMSQEDKMQTRRYINVVWSLIKKEVSRSRHIPVSELDKYANQVYSTQSPTTYVNSQMADGIMYRNELDSFLYRRFGQRKPNIVTTQDLLHVERSTEEFNDRIAVIYAEGNIVDQHVQGTAIERNEIVRQMRSALRSPKTKAVVLRVNSPGGSADASEQIWHALSLFRDKNIPVVVSMSDYAASGGYYISVCADYIIAQPNTLTGSIGIFGMVPNVNAALNKIGISIDSVKTNAHAGIYNNLFYGKVNDVERNFMQRRIERGYDLFLSRCAQGRHTSYEQINKIAQGRIWMGRDALHHGLIDQLGGIQDAINKAAELAHLTQYSIRYYPQKANKWNELLKLLDTSSDEEKVLLAMKQFLSQPRVLCLSPQIEINKY